MTDPTSPTEVLTGFFVIVQRDGRVTVATESIPAITMDHAATLIDIETFSAQVSREAGRLLLAHELRPTAPESPADQVAGALARRLES